MARSVNHGLWSGETNGTLPLRYPSPGQLIAFGDHYASPGTAMELGLTFTRLDSRQLMNHQNPPVRLPLHANWKYGATVLRCARQDGDHIVLVTPSGWATDLTVSTRNMTALTQSASPRFTRAGHPVEYKGPGLATFRIANMRQRPIVIGQPAAVEVTNLFQIDTNRPVRPNPQLDIRFTTQRDPQLHANGAADGVDADNVVGTVQLGTVTESLGLLRPTTGTQIDYETLQAKAQKRWWGDKTITTVDLPLWEEATALHASVLESWRTMRLDQADPGQTQDLFTYLPKEAWADNVSVEERNYPQAQWTQLSNDGSIEVRVMSYQDPQHTRLADKAPDVAIDHHLTNEATRTWGEGGGYTSSTFQ